MSHNDPDVVPSPNIWAHEATYEVENRAVDPDGVVDAAIRAVHDWRGQRVLDVGCGNGYHLPRVATDAAEVVGVEPHPPLLRTARRRLTAAPPDVAARVRLLQGTAQHLPMPDASVDLAIARWAYFFGPGCEPGLAELARVVRRGGTAFVVDVDATRSTFGRWFRQSLPRYDGVGVQRFWARQGWHREPLDLRWVFADRADLEAVVRIELTPDAATGLLAEVPGLEMDYAANLFSRHF
ncbi:MAG: class I SAM-dependent methyltransferase [Angustibacter sp.]